MSGPGNRKPNGLGAGSILDLLRGWSAPLAYSAAGSVVLGGCAGLVEQTPEDTMRRALDQQEVSGWNIGSEWKPLVFPGARDTDVLDSARWRDEMTTLAARLAPANGRWTPYYNPTLFQALEAPRNGDLRAVVRPIFTPEMWMAWRRGEALRALLMHNGACRTDVALVLDLPGPDAVAAAAGLMPCVDPIFTFANWPHPQGVVPAHQTLAATLYFLPGFEAESRERVANAAPAFVLDRNRLARYIDFSGRFDNRYLAGLPDAGALRSAGIRHVLYVTPDDQVTVESDDLNDDLVEIDQGGIDVKMLALSDFAQAPLPGWPPIPRCTPTPTATTEAPPAAAVPGDAGGAVAAPLFFGGSLDAQSCFPYWYGWEDPPQSVAGPPDPPPAGPISLPPSSFSFSFTIPSHLAPRCHFHPSPRATGMFAGHAGVGGGFRGHFGMGAFNRSGSMGRVHGGGFGFG